MPLRLSLLVLGFVVLASPLRAAPIEFHVQMTVGDKDGVDVHPTLNGASIELIYRLNTASLVPIEDGPVVNFANRATAWPTVNTTVTAWVTGAASGNGIYPGAMEASTTQTWTFMDDRTFLGGDVIGFPNVQFEFNGSMVRLINLRAEFSDLFTQGASAVVPVPFASASATWNTPAIHTIIPAFSINGLNLTGYAVALPEPTAAILALVGFALLSFCRRK